jgi:uncharacterized repeat protein (TIGR03803 family)
MLLRVSGVSILQWAALSLGAFQVQLPQTITFGALPNREFGTAPFTVSATASSGLPVSFASLNSNVCTVSGATVTLIAVVPSPLCTIQATQAGNANYAAATPVNQYFEVTPAVVILSATTSPPVGQVGSTLINVTGSGFPSGTILPADVRVDLSNIYNGAQASATAVTTIAGSVRRVSFYIPASATSDGPDTPRTYLVAISGTTPSGGAFSTGYNTTLIVDPPATIASISPNIGAPGRTTSVTITGSFTDFVEGATVANFGPAISVGGAAEGAPGPVTVNNSGSLTAQVTIDPLAAAGIREVTVTTGTQQGSNSFVVSLWSFVLLHSFLGPFAGAPKGAQPVAGVTMDSAGNAYGTTFSGGECNSYVRSSLGCGVVFKVDPAGNETVLYSFTGGADGDSPTAGVIRDSTGNLYGTTQWGGIREGSCKDPGGCGVVFKLDPGGNETVLYRFTGGADGGYPRGGVILDSAGNLYGTTSAGGINYPGPGVVFKLDTTGHYTVLYSFTGGADGGDPGGSLARDSAGNLYGATGLYGSNEVVYKLDPAGNYTALYTFTGGANPNGVILDPAGNLYGTTSGGGTVGAGVAYKLDTTGLYTVLYNFTGEADGSSPSSLIRDSAGNLYGTTSGGGSAPSPSGYGVVFKLDPTNGYHYKLLFTFTDGDGANPSGGVIRDLTGNLYGTTVNGGARGLGTVYKLDAKGEETLLYSFPDPTDGSDPAAPLILDPVGNLYGTTDGDGAGDAGIVYKLDPAGQETVLYGFTDGSPTGSLALDSAGNLYGAAGEVVYKLDPAGNYTALYTFTGGADGANPTGVIIDPAGNLYGATSKGGTAGAGVVFKLNTAGQETVLYTFTGGADGANPTGVIIDPAGNLYGTTSKGGTARAGVVFKLNTAGQEMVLYTFTGGADGGDPNGVVLDSEGNLYGSTGSGGNVAELYICPSTPGCGVVFKLNTAGQETVLYTFMGAADGGDPNGVILDSEGNLYGTTYWGGNYSDYYCSYAGCGVVFELNAAGHYTVLYSFTGQDGVGPSAGLVLDSNGNLYGTTHWGGPSNTDGLFGGGVVFKLVPQ